MVEVFFSLFRLQRRIRPLCLQLLCSLSDTIHSMVSPPQKFKLFEYIILFAQIKNIFIAALHRGEGYKHLMNDEDVENLKWLQIFK